MAHALPVVRSYHGESAEPLEAWTGFDAVELFFEAYGPETGRLVVPANAPFLHHTRSMPGGAGVFLEVDARDAGVPHVWTGRFQAPQFGGGSPSVSAQLAGPRSWLENVGVVGTGETAECASAAVRKALQAAKGPTYVRMDEGGYTGMRAPVDLSGQALWPLITALATERGEEPQLEAQPGAVDYMLRWSHPLEAPDLSGRATLIDGRNCVLGQSAHALGAPLTELVATAQSWDVGSEYVTSAAKVIAPVGARLGLRAALHMVATSAIGRSLAGDPVAPMPETTTREALELALQTALVRASIPRILAQINDVDDALWPLMTPGAVVGAQLRDPFGLMQRALVRIRTATFRPTPPRSCALSVELWATEASDA